MDNTTDKMPQPSTNNIGHDAMRLALTRTMEEENQLKKEYQNLGNRFIVTEVGGTVSGDFQERINRSILGAALNGEIIEKNSWEIHALFHAAEEAKRGVLVNSSSDTSLSLKIAIVRREHWIAIAIFGYSAIHPLTNHERCGLGIMHI